MDAIETADVAGPARYPSEWEADVVLSDGATAHLRPIRPEDADGIQEFHLGQSPESIYLRFFAPMPRLSEKDLYRFTNVDHTDRVALVVTIGGAIVGIGRYDRIDGSTAEVAFNIADAHHGRGVGSVLLEHLAAAARENGLHKFMAEVLPQNRKMIGVFRDAGYEVDHRYEDGVISLSFRIDPTDKSLAVMESREHRAESRSVGALLNPTSVVLVGASRREGTIGHRLLADLLAAGYTGSLHVVHPEARSVLGVPAHRTLADVPGHVDLAIIAVSASRVLDVVADCAAKGVRGLLVVSGGFAEEGPEGLARQRELVRVARANGMRVIGPDSWGLINAVDAVRLNVSLVEDLPPAGRLGLFAQSAASTVLAHDALHDRGIGVSTFVSTGNRADVSGNDCLQYWEEDEQTDVVGMYLESMGNPRKFSRIVRRLSRSKPVVVVTSRQAGFLPPPGHTIRDSRAPTGALDALLQQSGCIRVESVTELVDVAALLLDQPLPAGGRVAVVTNTHGLAAQVGTLCATAGLEVAGEPAVLPVVASPGQFESALRTALARPDADSLVVALVPPLATHAADLAGLLGAVAEAADKPVVGSFLGMPGVRTQLDAVRTVSAYPTPQAAVRALGKVVGYQQWRRRDPGARFDAEDLDRAGAESLVDDLLTAHPAGVELDDDTTGRLLACYGIELWPSIGVSDRHDAVRAANRLGWPVALKTTAPHLRHRVDLGGVRLGIGGPSELADHLVAMKRVLAPLGGDDIVVQRMAPNGVACVVRTVEDPLFGPVVTFGVGGDASDLLGDVALRIPPLTDVDVADLVRSVRAAPKLFGHRGARPVYVEGLHEVIARAATLAMDLPEVFELELNPVVAGESSVAVLGATIRLAPDAGRSDAGVRLLR